MSTKNENKLERESIRPAEFRVWKQTQNLLSDDIMQNIHRNQLKIKNYTEALNEEEKNDKKKKIKNHQSFDAFRHRKKKDLVVSDNVQKIMTDVGKLVLDMKIISENSYKNNINSLINTSNQIKRTEILSEPNTILKIKEREYKASLEGKTKRVPNYQFLADSYRRQINKAFVNYNPNIHLSSIHKLKENDPETEKEYQQKLKEVNDITKIKNSYLFGNDYKNEQKLDKSNEIKEEINAEDKSNILGNNNSIGYSVGTAETDNPSIMRHPTQMIPSQGNLFGKKKKFKNKKQEIKRKFPEKEKREKELSLMSSVLCNIGNSISNENIGNYFDKYKELTSTDIPQQRHLYFKGMGKANKLLAEIQEILHYKDADDDANIKKRIVTNESDALVEKIGAMKKSVINEIEAYEKKQK